MRNTIIIFILIISNCISGYTQIETISTKDTSTYSEKEVKSEEKLIKATALRLTGKSKDAIPILQELIRENKYEPTYYYELARDYFIEKDYTNAQLNANKAVHLDKNNIYFALFEAQTYEAQNNPLMAAEIYENIVAQYPREDDYYLKLSNLYRDAGLIPKAVGTIDRLMVQLGETEEALYRKFQLQLNSDKPEDSLATLQKLVAIAPDNIFYKERLAGAYLFLNKKQEAIDLYKEILTIDPTNARANMAMTELSSPNGGEGQKLNSLTSFVGNPDVSIDQKVGEIVSFLDKYLQFGDTTLETPLKSIADLLVKTHPEEAKAWALGGDIYLHLGIYPDALNAYNRALGLTNKVYSVFDQKLLILTYLKRYDELIKFANQTLDIYPNQLNVYISLAYAQLKTNDLQAASNTLNVALLMAPEDQPNTALLSVLAAVVQKELKNPKDADNYITKAESLCKNDTDLKVQIAGILADFDIMLPRAKKLIESPTVHRPNDPFVAATAALIEFKSKNYTTALKWIDEAIKTKGLKYPTIAEQAGDIYFMVKNTAKAMEYWNLAKSLGMDYPTLNKKIETKSYIQ